MKAIVKLTGEHIDVTPYGMMSISCASYKDESGRMIPATALEFEKNIDWEQRRYEIAKDITCAYMQTHICNIPFKDIVEASVTFADKLIDQLKAE
jgi:hypothetical protein